jgi:hypothetical protein
MPSVIYLTDQRYEKQIIDSLSQFVLKKSSDQAIFIIVSNILKGVTDSTEWTIPAGKMMQSLVPILFFPSSIRKRHSPSTI